MVGLVGGGRRPRALAPPRPCAPALCASPALRAPVFGRKGTSVAACEGRAGCPGGQAAHARETFKKAIDVTWCFSNLISKGQQGMSVLGSYLSRTTPRCGHQTP